MKEGSMARPFSLSTLTGINTKGWRTPNSEANKNDTMNDGIKTC